MEQSVCDHDRSSVHHPSITSVGSHSFISHTYRTVHPTIDGTNGGINRRSLVDAFRSFPPVVFLGFRCHTFCLFVVVAPRNRPTVGRIDGRERRPSCVLRAPTTDGLMNISITRATEPRGDDEIALKRQTNQTDGRTDGQSNRSIEFPYRGIICCKFYSFRSARPVRFVR